jgi:hypothetical protein
LHAWTEDRECQAAIIAPVSFKEEINFPATQPLELSKLLHSVWQAAFDCIRTADQIIIIGVSFAAADFHLDGLFRLASKRRSAPYERLVYCHVGEKKEDVERVARIFLGQLFPSGLFAEEPDGFCALINKLDSRVL